MNTYRSENEAETRALGQAIGAAAMPGLVIAFYGDLGAGKTAMTKGIAEGLGIRDMITSPTFTILQSYEEGRIPLHHLDVYRIEDPDEMEEVGLDDCLFGGGVCLIEWAEQIEDLLPEKTVRVTITRCGEDTERKIMIEDPAGLLPVFGERPAGDGLRRERGES